MPNLYPGDIILLNERCQDGDNLLCKGKILDVYAYRFCELKEKYCLDYPNWSLDNLKNCIIEEIEKYKRRFNNFHYFFEIIIKIIK